MASSYPSTAPPTHRKPLPEESPVNSSKNSSKYSLPPLKHTDSDLGLSVPANPIPRESVSAHGPQDHTRKQSASTGRRGSMGRLQKNAPPPPQPSRRPSKVDTPPQPPLSGGSGFNFNFGNKDGKSPRLQKEQRRRSSSLNSSSITSSTPTLVNGQQTQPANRYSPPPEVRARSSSAQPPARRETMPHNRVVSNASAGPPRPASSQENQSHGQGERRGRLRRSWLPGGRSRSQSQDVSKSKDAVPSTASAWIIGQNVDYNLSYLANAEKVPELWNELGDVYVYLDPKGSGGGPCFKVPSFFIGDSLVFAELIEAEATSPASSERDRTGGYNSRDNLSAFDANRQNQSPPATPPLPDETRLYLPVSMSTPGSRTDKDMDRIVSCRNLFAFLTGQPLVGTKSQPTLFKVLLNIASLLKEFEFTNDDGSNFGDAVEMSFSFLLERTNLADVRHSREKTIEALILGERMHNMELYSEAFAHGVGKYSALRSLKSPLWEMLSADARERLERAHFELVTRQNSVNNRLESFEFPAIFSGVANSTSLTEYKDVKYATWRKSFNRMRSFVLGYYKTTFGSWPPKARSKKNPFSESGLNRQVLKILYSDLCALYDLLVDRQNVTTRVIDQGVDDIVDDHENPHISALRKVLGEYDMSSPPVLPPIPFDTPKLPSMTSIRENYNELTPKEKAKLERNLQDYQRVLILTKAYDIDTYKLKIPFLEEFKEFEQKECKGKTASEMADQRLGIWLFLYVVIQTLPMLVVDAPGLKYTEGVEYFLCQPPKGSPPWMEDVPAVRKRWYEVAGGGGLVELSADAVEFGIEGIYHRSHCWLQAKRWELGEDAGPPPAPHDSLSPLQAPASVFLDNDPATRSSSPTQIGRSESPSSGPPGAALRAPTGSPGNRVSSYRSSIAFGLEPVAMPFDGGSRPNSRVFSSRGLSPAERRESIMTRSRSSGNLHGMATAAAASPTQAPLDSGSTFDDILKDMNNKPKKKKGGLF
ncbi:hypothetical protein F4780DRAFT_336561 [Xylariomycetidae sp. FL0641]|nr:hypothetical protein F4780DRAFT_336561 [Xylariomycetidae sp. FL0641]